MKNIIINADDFGYNSSVNQAIAESFNKGIITSTTLLANMPGFDEAVDLAHSNNLLTKIGIHLNLTEGYPLTQKILNTDLFYNENNSNLKKHKKNLFFLSSDEKKVIFNEFSAQIEKVSVTGIKISHIDTHHHIDEVWPITKIIQTLLRKYNIPSMRILNNMNNSTSFYKKTYRKMVNSQIKMNHVNYTDYLGNQIEVISKLQSKPSFCGNKKIEIMVHPDYNNMGIIIDKIGSSEYSFDYPEDFKKQLQLQGLY